MAGGGGCYDVPVQWPCPQRAGLCWGLSRTPGAPPAAGRRRPQAGEEDVTRGPVAPAQQSSWGWAPKARPRSTGLGHPHPQPGCSSPAHVSGRNHQAQARRQVTHWDGRLPSSLFFQFFFFQLSECLDRGPDSSVWCSDQAGPWEPGLCPAVLGPRGTWQGGAGGAGDAGPLCTGAVGRPGGSSQERGELPMPRSPVICPRGTCIRRPTAYRLLTMGWVMPMAKEDSEQHVGPGGPSGPAALA